MLLHRNIPLAVFRSPLGKTDSLFCDKQNCAGYRISEQMMEPQLERAMGSGYQVGRIESTRDELLGGPDPGFTITDGYDAIVTFICSKQTDAKAAHALIAQAITKAASIVAAYL